MAHRPISRTWWGQRLTAALEAIGGEGRMARGRTYTRGGRVRDLEVAPGKVRARVLGNDVRPYSVTIGLSVLSKERWATMDQALLDDPRSRDCLVAGVMPPEIEDVFDEAGLVLFPHRGRDLSVQCSCPDVESPCKHAAAVLYAVAAASDGDPFLIFRWRGHPTAAWEMPPHTEAEEGWAKVPWGSDDLEAFDFWLATAPAPRVLIPEEPMAYAGALAEMEPMPLSVGGTPLSELLVPAYKTVVLAARQRLGEHPRGTDGPRP